MIPPQRFTLGAQGRVLSSCKSKTLFQIQSKALQWRKRNALEVTLYPPAWQKEAKKKNSHIPRQNPIQEHKVLIVKLLSGQALYQELQHSEHDSPFECRKGPF